MHPLPSRIQPNPLIQSTAEIQFEPLIDRKAVFGTLYERLRGQFPTLAPLSVPAPGEVSVGSPYASPQYCLTNEQYAVYIGEQMLAVGVLGTYPGWAAFQEVVAAVFGVAHSAGVVGAVDRLGVRYISFFADNIIPQLQLRVQLPGYEIEDPINMQVRLKAGECLSLLNVAYPVSFAQLTGRADAENLAGTIIDIDASLGHALPDFFARPLEWLDIVHTAEKQLFFDLLTTDFLASLQPAYA